MYAKASLKCGIYIDTQISLIFCCSAMKWKKQVEIFHEKPPTKRQRFSLNANECITGKFMENFEKSYSG